MKPGEYILRSEPITCNAGGKTRVLNVINRGDRPIQVGSHYHVAEVNRSLDMDRVAARGFRLDIPAGTAVRFEPGDARSVYLVEIAGNREIHGLQDLVNGPLGGIVPAIDTEAIGGTAGLRPVNEPEIAAGYEVNPPNVGHEKEGFLTTFGWDEFDESRGPQAQAAEDDGGAGPADDGGSSDGDGEDRP